MKVAIIGAGAMGSVYAGRFAEAGSDVVAIDPWSAHVEAIARNGLRIEGPDGDRIVSGIKASTDPEIATGGSAPFFRKSQFSSAWRTALARR
jgi:2-dehydropantoate 2-reductase